MAKETMKCKIFQWTLNCRTCTPENFDDWEADFRFTICPYLLTMVSADDMNDYDLIPRLVHFNYQGDTELIVAVPADKYDSDAFEKICEEMEVEIDNVFGSWDFEQMPDDEQVKGERA